VETTMDSSVRGKEGMEYTFRRKPRTTLCRACSCSDNSGSMMGEKDCPVESRTAESSQGGFPESGSITAKRVESRDPYLGRV